MTLAKRATLDPRRYLGELARSWSARPLFDPQTRSDQTGRDAAPETAASRMSSKDGGPVADPLDEVRDDHGEDDGAGGAESTIKEILGHLVDKMDPSDIPAVIESILEETGKSRDELLTELVGGIYTVYPAAQDVTVEPDSVATLGNRTTIHLGPDGLRGGGATVSATLDADYVASSSKDDMLSEYLPLFWDSLSLSWEDAHANVSERWDQDLVMGLFWDDGWGYMHRALLYALQLVHLFADEARDPTDDDYSGYSVAELRSRLEAGTFPLFVTDDQVITTEAGSAWIHVSGDGHVSTQVSGISYWAITLDVIELPVATRVFAATADYLFWWAHRLHSHAHETGNLEEWWVGSLCARAALAELAQLAALIVHEWGHMTSGSAFHCVDLAYRGVGCIQWMMMHTFQVGVMARLALPQPRNIRFGLGAWFPDPASDNRFDYAIDGDWTDTLEGANQLDGGEVEVLIRTILVDLGLGLIGLILLVQDVLLRDSDFAEGCGAFSITFKRRFWAAGSGYDAVWAIPSRCLDGGTDSGAFAVAAS